MHPSDWRLDVDRWPGPDRLRWNISRDLVIPSPDGRFACVLYSCTEIRLGCEAGLLTVLEGPPNTPTVVFQPPRFTCLDFSPEASAMWMGQGRFAVVTAYHYRGGANRVELLALTFLDTAMRTFAHREITLAQAGRWRVDEEDDWRLTTVRTTLDRFDLRASAASLRWTSWEKSRQP